MVMSRKDAQLFGRLMAANMAYAAIAVGLQEDKFKPEDAKWGIETVNEITQKQTKKDRKVK